MLATACSEYQEVVDYEPIVLNSPESVEVEGLDNSSFKVSYTALSRVEMSTDCNWIVVPSNFDGNSNGTFTITTLPNSTITERTGKLILTATDPRFAGGMSYSKTITVTQGGGRPTINAYIKSAINTKSYTAPDEGETVNLYVKSNAYFEVSSSAAWIKFNNKSSYSGKGNSDAYAYEAIEMTIAPNPYEWDRGATITISGEANGAGQNYDIVVKQSKWDIVWSVSRTEVELDYKGKSNYSLSVSSSFSWKATCDADWIELKNTQYTSSDKYASGYINLYPTIKENMSVDDRSAEIVIQCTESGYTDKKLIVKIMQTGRPELYFSDTADYSVSFMAGNYSVGFFSEVDWKASSNSDWLTIVSGYESGNGKTYNQTVYFNATKNNSSDSRTATITIASKSDADVKATLQVIQSGTDVLFYKSSSKLNLTDALFDVTIAEHTFDESKREGMVTFNGDLKALTDQDATSTSVFNGATQVYLPGTLTYIGTAAFRNCEKLYSVPIPESVKEIGGYAFYGCYYLSDVNNPDGVTIIKERTFDNCDLTTMTIPDSVVEIADYAFFGCDQLRSVEMSNNLEKIGHGAFAACYYLGSITLPTTLTKLGTYVFAYCEQLTDITIPEGVTTIGSQAFYNCESLASVTLPSALTEIGRSAFAYCKQLTDISIPEGVTTIGSQAFENCGLLASVTLPSTLTEIGRNAFTRCEMLKKVYISDIAKWCKINFVSEYFEGYTYSNPLDVADAALYLNGSEVTEIKANDMGIEKFGSRCFAGCSSIKEVYVDGKDIEEMAFFSCQHITYVADVSKVGDHAFGSCTSLKNLRLKSATIGWYAFLGCTNLEEVTHADGCNTKTIGYRAFYNCSNLISYTQGNNKGADSIGEEAFYGCTSLQSIVIGSAENATVTVGENAFKGCTDLERVEFRDYASSITIGYQAFDNCSSLSKLTFPQNTTGGGGIVIKDYAFNECSNLAEVDLGYTTKSIGAGAFYRSSGNLAVICRSSTPPTGSSGMFPRYSSNVHLDIRVFSRYLDAYKSAQYWSDYADFILGM